MARTKNHSSFLRRGYRPDSSPDSEERGRPNKRVFVADDGQGGSDQVEDDAENDTEEEVETRHVSPEKRVTRNGGKKKTVAPAVEEDSENDTEEEEETEHVVTVKRGTRKPVKNKPAARAPKTSIKSHTMPVRDGLVLEKRKPKHTRNYKVTNYKAMSRANNEDIASSSTARPKIRFRTKGYEEFFENASSDEDGGSASEDATE